MAFNKIIFLLLLCAGELVSAQSPSIQWQKVYGGAGTDQFAQIIKVYDNGYLIQGGSNSTNGDVLLNHGGSWDPWIARIDSLGNILWNRCYGGSSENDALGGRSQISLGNGDILICGFTSSNDGDVSGNHNPGTNDGWLVEIDSIGHVVKQKCFGGTGNDAFLDIKQTNNGGYILVGLSSSTDYDLIGVVNKGGNDEWIVKIDSSWNIQWQKRLGGSGTEIGQSVYETTDHGYIIGGESNSSDGDISSPYGLQDYWLTRIDSVGNLLWEKSYGGSHDEYFQQLKEDCNGHYYLIGYTMSIDGLVTGSHDTTFGGGDYWVLKLDTSGNVLWKKCYGGSKSDYCYSGNLFDSELILSGITESNDSDVSGNHGSSDAWIVSVDTSAGSIIWKKCFGGSDGDDATWCIKTSDGGYFFLGYTMSVDGDLTGTFNHGNGDAWVVKLGPTDLGISEPHQNIMDLAAFINNAGNLSLRFYARASEKMSVRVLDVTGRTIAAQSLFATEGINHQQVKLPELAAGVYVVSLDGVAAKVVVQ